MLLHFQNYELNKDIKIDHKFFCRLLNPIALPEIDIQTEKPFEGLVEWFKDLVLKARFSFSYFGDMEDNLTSSSEKFNHLLI